MNLLFIIVLILLIVIPIVCVIHPPTADLFYDFLNDLRAGKPENKEQKK